VILVPTIFVVLVTMKYLVFGMFAATAGRPALMGATGVTLVAMTFAFLPTHVFRALLSLATRVTTAAAVMISAMVIVLRIAGDLGNQYNSKCKYERPD
jgi:hypothetical protein